MADSANAISDGYLDGTNFGGHYHRGSIYCPIISVLRAYFLFSLQSLDVLQSSLALFLGVSSNGKLGLRLRASTRRDCAWGLLTVPPENFWSFNEGWGPWTLAHIQQNYPGDTRRLSQTSASLAFGRSMDW